jgi:hypothetical protein
MSLPLSIRKYRHAIAEKRHYSTDHFNAKIAPKIEGSDGTWTDSSGLQSCAMRLSIALAYAGVHFPRVKNSWRLTGTKVYFPSRAGDYPDILSGGQTITAASEVKNRKGAIYFGGTFASASGHVTLWNGRMCHFDPANDSFWSQPTIIFWEMS